MPVVNGGAQDGVDILVLEQFPVVVVGLRVAAGLGLGGFEAFLPDVAHGADGDVVLLGIGLDGAEMETALAAETDEAHHDAVIGTDDAAGGWRRVLAVNRGLEDVRAGDDGGGGGGLLDEVAAVVPAGGAGIRVLVHKLISVFHALSLTEPR